MASTSAMIAALAAKHRLPVETVQDALDQVLCSKAFRQATSSEFGQVTSEGVIVFRDRGVSLLGELKRPLSRLLTGELEKILTDAATAIELEQWQRFQQQVVCAQIERCTPEGDLEVLLERVGVFGESTAELLARCSLRNLSIRDRQTLRPGQSKCFYVQKVNAVRCGDAPASISIELSRVTPRLTEYLIRRELRGKKVNIKCWKRVAGRVSYVTSDHYVPLEAIKSAGEELGERIRVEYASPSAAKGQIKTANG